jgi:RhoGAP domain
LETYGLDQEGLFRINPSVQELTEIQAKVESGSFIQFPPHSAHLVAGFLLRLLKSTPLLPHSIVELTLNLDGVVDKPLRNLRVLAAICDAIDSASEESRGILARFSKFLIEISLHPVTKMTLRNLVICVGSCLFGTALDSQGSDLSAIAFAQKEAGVAQECGFLLLQNTPVFFDDVSFAVASFSSFISSVTLTHTIYHSYHRDFYS